MRHEADARPPVDGTEGLNALLRGELAAVNAYQRALRSAEGRATVDAGRSFASPRSTREPWRPAGRRPEMGGVPASEAGTWGAFALLRDTAMVRELLDGEVAGLKMYEAANRSSAGRPATSWRSS